MTTAEKTPATRPQVSVKNNRLAQRAAYWATLARSLAALKLARTGRGPLQ